MRSTFRASWRAKAARAAELREFQASRPMSEFLRGGRIQNPASRKSDRTPPPNRSRPPQETVAGGRVFSPWPTKDPPGRAGGPGPRKKMGPRGEDRARKKRKRARERE